MTYLTFHLTNITHIGIVIIQCIWCIIGNQNYQRPTKLTEAYQCSVGLIGSDFAINVSRKLMNLTI